MQKSFSLELKHEYFPIQLSTLNLTLSVVSRHSACITSRPHSHLCTNVECSKFQQTYQWTSIIYRQYIGAIKGEKLMENVILKDLFKDIIDIFKNQLRSSPQKNDW